MNKKQLNYERRASKRRKLINGLKNEIIELENEIVTSKIQNKKNLRIKNFKLAGRITSFITPYILTAGIVIGITSYNGMTPFVFDNEKQYANVKRTFDSHGNIRCEQQYKEYDNKTNIINYCGKWEPIGNDFYKRNIEVYNIGKISESSVAEILKKPNGSLKDYFGEPILTKVEKKNNVTSEQLEEDAFLQAIVYSESKADYIMVKESIKDNVLWSILVLIVTLVAEVLPFRLTLNLLYKQNEWGKSINNKYPVVDIHEKEKKLEIKKSNYNMLTR